MRSQVYFQKGLAKEALAEADQAVKFDGHCTRAFRIRGHIARLSKDYDNAITDYSAAVASNPKDAESKAGRGICWYMKGENAKAIADLSTAPVSPNYRDNSELVFEQSWLLGQAYVKARDHQKAVSAFTQVINLRPTFVAAYYSRAASYNAIGDRVSANRDLRKAMQLSK